MRLLPGLLCLAVAVPLLAQTSARVDVRVVNVDVSVIDGSGKSVTGLKPADFEILEDNRPEKVTNFTLVDRAAARAGGRGGSDAQLRRRVILLVDNNYIDKS